MNEAPTHPRDPLIYCWLIAIAFAAIAGVRLGIPTTPYFDEVHYLPAARAMLEGGAYLNREHPLLGKELIALGIWLFGDNPLGWRTVPLIAGTLALFAGMRAVWHASADRFTTITFGILFATGFHLFIHARLAMLDVFMVAFLCIAGWQLAAAIREPETGRWRLALTGIALGLAMASKWNAVPLAMVPGLAFFAARLSAGRQRLITSTRGIPVPGVSLAEAFVWLGIAPLLVYAATYWPGYALVNSPLSQNGLIGLHEEMLSLQTAVLQSHPYQSRWPEWMLNIRGIWYLYEYTDDAQRGVLLIGNPLTMLLGLPALLWCAFTAITQRDAARWAIIIGYAVSLGMWLIADKPIQFYYHYFTPHIFLLGALSFAASDLYRSANWRWLGYAIPLGSVVIFALFYKIISAAPLDTPMSFADWALIAGWR